MNLEYLLARKTGGANPFKIWEVIENQINQEALAFGLKRMPYRLFLESAYWFAVSTVAKSRAGMRCSVCNSADGIQAHHRTYDNHGYEHSHMNDIVVLCANCHGLFHGHQSLEYKPPRLAPKTGTKMKLPKLFVVPHTDEDVAMPDGDPIELTEELISRCRANGSFTNATLRAFGMKQPLMRGWATRLIGTKIPRADYFCALEGRFLYKSGPLEKAS